MQLRFQEWLPELLGFQSLAQFGVQQAEPKTFEASTVDCSTFLAPKPKAFETVSLAVVRDNLAVAPTTWESSGIIKPWFSINSHASFTDCMAELSDTSFISFNNNFLNFLGSGAKLETIHTFTGVDAQHVHEAPVYIPITNELLFADTSVVGWLWALQIDTHKIRKVNTNPPLENVNGATMRDSRIYLTTNGGRMPGVWNCSAPISPPNTDADALISKEDVPSDSKAYTETMHCVPVVNNYRLKHLNSPNDLIFTSTGNILFTDPTYGWAQSWPGIGPPELPTATYHFNTKTRALVALDNDQVLQPNGLALSVDEKTLYVADSNSTSGKPIGVWDHSVRNIYAFDFDETSLTLKNRRLVHMVESGWPDGVRVTSMTSSKSQARRELVLVASMGGVDVVDASKGGAGVLLGKISVGDDIIFNLERAKQSTQTPKSPDVWLLTGKKGIYKATIASST